MKIEVRITKSFKKAIKPLIKEYPSVIKDLKHLQAALIKNPTTGTSLGNDFYKIRLKITSKGKGKSSGARVISYLEKEIIGVLEIKDLAGTSFHSTFYRRHQHPSFLR